MRIITLVVVVWLVIGAVAAWQRGYITNAAQNCATAGTTAVTVLAGPLNYFGVNPTVSNCNVPQPSQ
ncbi:MAG: hypothetical protein ABWY93_12120 [Mycobacterium sp.]